MNALIAHIEKFVLGVLLVALLICLWFFLQSLQKTSTTVKEMRDKSLEWFSPKGEIETLSPEAFSAADRLTGPALAWTLPEGENTRSMLLPRKYIYCQSAECPYIMPYDRDVCPKCGDKQGDQDEADTPTPDSGDTDGDKIADAYEARYDFLDNHVASDAQRDQDGDYFSNLEEYNAKTAPDDPGDHPPLAQKFRYTAVRKQRIPIKLYQVKTYDLDDKNDWDLFITLLRPGGAGRTKIFSIGDTIKDGTYTIADVEYRTRNIFDESVNMKRTVEDSLVRLRTKEGEELVLRKGKQALANNLQVSLLLLSHPTDADQLKRMNTRVGDIISLRDTASNIERYRVGFDAEHNQPLLVPTTQNGTARADPVRLTKFDPIEDLRQPEEVPGRNFGPERFAPDSLPLRPPREL